MITREMKLRAKKNSILVWDFLCKHPEIELKNDLPSHILQFVEDELFQCPLCTLFNPCKNITELACTGCPLMKAGDCCTSEDSSYSKWAFLSEGNMFDRIRRWAAARRILKIIKEWNVDDEM